MVNEKALPLLLCGGQTPSSATSSFYLNTRCYNVRTSIGQCNTKRRSDTMYQITKEKLRLIRTLTGVSQREFADLIRTNKRSVSAWEVGRSIPNVDSVKKIVDFVGEEEFRLLDSVVYALPLQDLSIKLKEKAASK